MPPHTYTWDDLVSLFYKAPIGGYAIFVTVGLDKIYFAWYKMGLNFTIDFYALVQGILRAFINYFSYAAVCGWVK